MKSVCRELGLPLFKIDCCHCVMYITPATSPNPCTLVSANVNIAIWERDFMPFSVADLKKLLPLLLLFKLKVSKKALFISVLYNIYKFKINHYTM